jgi:hypothetical protein
MLRKLAHHLRGNVVAYIALFFALGGTAYAAATIGSAEVIDNSLQTVDIRDDSDGGGLLSRDIRNDNQAGGGLGSVDVRPNTLGGADVNESTLGRVPSAGDSATLGGQTAVEIGPRGYAEVGADGSVSRSKNIGSEDVTRVVPPGGSPVVGRYCFDLPFPVAHVQTTTKPGGPNIATIAEVAHFAASPCPFGTDVTVIVRRTDTHAETDRPFYVAFWG